MKLNLETPINARSSHQAANPSDHRTAAVRPNATKTFEHRYERRKIREQLRRLDWGCSTADDEVFA
jgi:hypothetical protein